MWNSANSSWLPLPDLPSDALYYGTAVGYQNSIIVTGTVNGNRTAAALTYAAGVWTWTLLAGVAPRRVYAVSGIIGEVCVL
jgi:hypothetical protein